MTEREREKEGKGGKKRERTHETWGGGRNRRGIEWEGGREGRNSEFKFFIPHHVIYKHEIISKKEFS